MVKSKYTIGPWEWFTEGDPETHYVHRDAGTFRMYVHSGTEAECEKWLLKRIAREARNGNNDVSP